MDRAKVSERNKTNIAELHPVVQLKVGEYLAVCEAQLGIVMLVTDSYRSMDEQAKLFAIGRTKPGEKVTWVTPGHSWHQWGMAVDVYPLLSLNGNSFMINFDRHTAEGRAYLAYADKTFPLVRPIAEQVGFELLSIRKDPPHIQWTGGWTCQALLAAGYGHRPISEIPLPKP